MGGDVALLKSNQLRWRQELVRERIEEDDRRQEVIDFTHTYGPNFPEIFYNAALRKANICTDFD